MTTQALILVPTREIAVQIQDVLKAIGNRMKNLYVESFIGGLPIEEDKCKNCHIAVGTPGRVKYLIDKKLLDTSCVRLFVLDEADKLMEDSFKNDINSIYNSLPERKQMITTSATYPNELNTLLSNYMISPTHITAELETPLLLGLLQFVYPIPANSNIVQQMHVKTKCLIDVLTNLSFTQCLVFSNYQTRAESISNLLNNKGWNSTYISAAKTQIDRLNAVNQLKEFKCRILLSTDLAARGIDAANVDLVINYDIPNDSTTYLHRMGRAGRYGAAGICINLAEEGAELRKLQIILGCIVGENFNIPKLTNIETIKERDLSKIDISCLDFITTILPSNNEEISKVKKEIIEIKNKKKTISTSNQETVTNILNKAENQLNKLSDELNLIDAKSILQSMADGNMKPSYESLNNNCAETINVTTDLIDDNGKRKRINLQSPSDNIKEKIKTDNKTTIFYKNKTLLTVSKLLLQGNDDVNKDDIKSTEMFLRLQADDGLNCLENENISAREMLEKCIESNNCGGIEDVFKLAYNFACNSNSKHWMSCLSKKERDEFSEYREKVENFEETEEEQEYEEDSCENSEYEEQIVENNEVNDDNFMKWVPVEPNEAANSTKGKPTYYFNKDLEIEKYQNENTTNFATCTLNSEQFSTYYDQCSENLWQSGLSFDNVTSFDEWYFNDWQTQLYSIRNFIQQNVYVSEMSKFKKN